MNIDDYLKIKKKCCELDPTIYQSIHNLVEKYNQFNKPIDAIILQSTDIFPEILKYKNRYYLLFDLNYIKFVRLFLNNLILLNKLDKNSGEFNQILKNIKSDSYFLISLIHHDNAVLSLHFLKLSVENYRSVDIAVEVDEDFMVVFHDIINYYVLFHEDAHFEFSNKSIDFPTIIKFYEEQLLFFCEMLKNNRYKLNEEVVATMQHNFKIVPDLDFLNVIQKLIETKDSILYEELFCDYLSYNHLLIFLGRIHKNNQINGKPFEIFSLSALQIFDWISIYIRHLVESHYNFKFRKNKISDVNDVLRSLINPKLRISILACEPEFKDILDSKIYDYTFINETQDIFNLFIYKLIEEIQEEILNSNIEVREPEEAKVIRDEILKNINQIYN